MAKPLISILIRSTDRPTLQRAIDSVVAQTWPFVEIIVIAASGIEHRKLPVEINGRPLRLIYSPSFERLSRPDAANLAINNVHGEWFNFLDDDDELLPHHVEALMSAEGVAAQRVRYSRAEVRDLDGKATGTSGRAGFHAQLYFQARGTFMATMFHRSLIKEGVRFDPAFLSFEDRDFMVNCATRTAFGFVDSTTCVWHAHIGSSGTGHGVNQQQPSAQVQYLSMLRKKWAHAFERWLSEPQALLFYGQHLMREGKPAEALPYLEQALREVPDDVNAVNLCGMAHFRIGNLDRAEVLLRFAVERLPTHAGLRENLTLIQRERQQR